MGWFFAFNGDGWGTAISLSYMLWSVDLTKPERTAGGGFQTAIGLVGCSITTGFAMEYQTKTTT